MNNVKNGILLLGVRKYPVEWNDEPLHIICGLRKGAGYRYLKELVACDFDVEYDVGAQSKLFGDIGSPYHSFSNATMQWGFCLTEPQITSSIAYFINPDVQGERGVERCKAFVKALYRAAGVVDSKGILPSINDAKKGSLKVESERPVKVVTSDGDKNKRIDISIEWRTQSDKLQVVFIECKFDHYVTNEQLDDYENHAKKMICERGVKNGDYQLFLMLRKLFGRNEEEIDILDNKDWKSLTWHTFLHRLDIEVELGLKVAGDDVGPSAKNFAQLRRAVWEK